MSLCFCFYCFLKQNLLVYGLFYFVLCFLWQFGRFVFYFEFFWRLPLCFILSSSGVLLEVFNFFFFEGCTGCLPYEISDHKISLQIWSQFSSVLWQLFSGEFSLFAVFFPVLFLISFFSSIFDYVMSCFSLEEVNLPDQRFAGGVCRGSAMRYFRRAGLLPGA